MQIIRALFRGLSDRYELQDKAESIKEWLKRDEYKAQRRIALASSILLLAFMILLMSNCTGGPQVHP